MHRQNLLHKYIALEDDVFGYELAGRGELDHGSVYYMHLTSQTWRGMDWRHHLTVFIPDRVVHEDSAMETAAKCCMITRIWW